MVRWEGVGLLLAALCLLSLPFVSAHKFPVIEYTYVGHLWEAAYTTMPRQAVEGDTITLHVTVEHPNKDGPSYPIEGNVSVRFSVYQDDTRWHWYGGESYKNPNWQLVHRAEKESYEGPREYSADVIIDRVGSYVVTVDYYKDTAYIGQSMHTLDVEQRTVGPLFLVFSGIAIIGVLWGVRLGVL